MNLSLSLEKASSFSPGPNPVSSVVLPPASVALVGMGAAAKASLRLSVMLGVPASQADAAAETRGRGEGDVIG